MSYQKPIYVTQPFLPPLEEYVGYLERIWDNKILTNSGPFHQELENSLVKYLGVEHISLFTNATIALLTALQALNITGEVITTPFSFVATSHALKWNGIEPVFVDIDPITLNIDPLKIEAAITSKTTAIMPVHCYGNPCDVDEIRRIAEKHNLKVIYDAAHAFGIEVKDSSLLNFGDLSVVSFHATKVFNTFEGGAIVCSDKKIKQRIDHLKNFGFVDETNVVATGINGKMSEVSAAMGLLQLKYIDDVIERRKKIDHSYRTQLKEIKDILCVPRNSMSRDNFSYFPILIGSNCRVNRDALYQKFKEREIYARRYFFPLISSFPMYSQLPSAQPANLVSAVCAAESVLCLPIYPSLKEEDIKQVVAIIQENCS